jgi:hypothetical protein
MNIASQIVSEIDRTQKVQGLLGIAEKVKSDNIGLVSAASKKPVDVITLSEAAKAAIAVLNEADNKPVESTAHAARMEFMGDKLASWAMTTDIRFGDVASRTARGISTESLFGVAPKSGKEGLEDVTKITEAAENATTAISTVQQQNVVPTR